MPTINLALASFLSASLTWLSLPACDPLCSNRELKENLQQLATMNAQLERQIGEAELDLWALQNAQYVEHVARDELGYGRASDLTLVF